MTNMIKLTRKEYDGQGDLVSVSFSINADDINTINGSARIDSWECSIITMNDGSTVDTVETIEEIMELIKE